MIGAILACIAPFVHMIAPNTSEAIVSLNIDHEENKISDANYEHQVQILKEELKMFGYASPRSFWYSMGMPITMLYFGILIFITAPFIIDKNIRSAMKYSSTILLYVSLYYVIWVLWPGRDLPLYLYMISIGVMAFMATFTTLFLIRYNWNIKLKMEKLIHFISYDVYTKYIPSESKREYMDDSFEVYDDIT